MLVDPIKNEEKSINEGEGNVSVDLIKDGQNNNYESKNYV